MKFDFKDKIVLVTGGAQGIGKATAIEFAKANAKIVIADTNKQKGENTVNEIRSFNTDAIFIKTDVTIKEEVKFLIQEIVSRYGKLDYAINNAGVLHKTQMPIADCTEDEFDNIINTNLKGTWLCMKYEIKQMKEQYGGTIINLSSILGIAGVKEMPIYSASKAGIIQLTKTAAAQYADLDIRVNAIAPGFIDTSLQTPEVKPGQYFVDNFIPMKRFGEKEECAKAILFLCSKDASYITGQTLVIDGGMLTRVIC